MLKLDVICPETSNKEQIGCLADRDGEVLVVLRCSRFEPHAELHCCETCRAQVNDQRFFPRRP